MVHDELLTCALSCASASVSEARARRGDTVMADDKYVRVVVVAVDESEDAMKAVKRAASLTTVNSRTQLHLVTAVPVPPLDLGAVSGGPGG